MYLTHWHHPRQILAAALAALTLAMTLALTSAEDLANFNLGGGEASSGGTATSALSASERPSWLSRELVPATELLRAPVR